MREIACPSCKYGVTAIEAKTINLFTEVSVTKMLIKRRCTSCGAEMNTWTIDERVPLPGNMPPPKPPPRFEQATEMRDDHGNLLFNPECL